MVKLNVVNKELKQKGISNIEVTRDGTTYYVLHILRNGVPVPLYQTEDENELKDYLKLKYNIGGKGWKESADQSGKAPKHVKAANKRKVSGVSKVPMVRKEKDWKKVAKKELEKELGVKTKLSAYGNDDENQLTLESTTGEGSNGESEWVIFKNEDEARSAATAQVKQDLENEPELFTQSWLQNFITISDTDKRIIAGEEADAYVDNQMENREDDLIKEADESDWIEGEKFADQIETIDNEISKAIDEDKDTTALDKKREKIIDAAKERIRSDKQEEIERELEDPVEYFVEHQGIYSREDLMKQSFIRIDVDKAAEDAIDTDGIAHFLDRYDSSELELPSGAIAYGTN